MPTLGPLRWAHWFSISYTGGWDSFAWAPADLLPRPGDGAILPETILVFSRAALIALAISVVLIILQKPIELLSFLVLKGETRVEELAMSYFRIRVWAAPAALGQFALLGFLPGHAECQVAHGGPGLHKPYQPDF